VEALEFKKVLIDVLNSLEVKVNLSGHLSFNVKDVLPPIVEPPIVEPPIVPPIEPPVEPPSPDNKVTVWSQNFESTPVQNPYDTEQVKNDFPWKTYKTGRNSYIDTNEYVSIENFDGLKCLKNHYQEGHWGVGVESSNSEGGTGVNIFSVIHETDGWDELYFTYNLFFEDGFDWGLGGKLPGLVVIPWGSLGRPQPDEGSVCMLMWQPDGKIKWYNYFHEDFDYKYGRGPVIPATFSTGKWFNITIRLVNSSPWGNDGLCEVFVDGILNHTMTNIRTREESDKFINAMTFNTFQGGGDNSYAPDVTKNMWMKGLEIFQLTGESTPETPIGKVPSQESPPKEGIFYW